MPPGFTYPRPGPPQFTQGDASFSFEVSQCLARKDSLDRRQQSSWQYVTLPLQPATVCYPGTSVENSKMKFKSTGPVQPPNQDSSGRQLLLSTETTLAAEELDSHLYPLISKSFVLSSYMIILTHTVSYPHKAETINSKTKT